MSLGALILAGCTGATPVTSPSVVPSTSSAPSPASTAPTATAEASPGACVLAGGSNEETVLSSGRCTVPDFEPAMSFESIEGWLWAGNADRWVTATREVRSSGEIVRVITVYRYGGAVVPAYCEDPPPLVPTTGTSGIVGWLESLDGLDVEVASRTIGGLPASQLELTARNAPGCAPGKSGLLSLWTIEGQPVELPESLDDGDAMRVILVEVGDEVVILTARSRGEANTAQFLLDAERIFASIAFD